MAGKIFINYRRGDDPGFAQALFGRLEQAFPPEQLFMDIDNIDPGLDFVKVLKEQVAQCDVLISVIGKNWIDARDESGARRLDNPADFVRIEIESALVQDKRVIPVLVGQAQMPRADELPDGMKPLATRNAVRLTHERFRSDAQGLVTALQRALKAAEDARAAEAEVVRRREAEQQRQQAEAAARAREQADHERRQRQAEAKQLRTEAERQRTEEQRQQAEAAAQAREAQLLVSAEPARGSRRTLINVTGVTLVLLAVAGAIVFKNYQPAPPPEIAAGQLTVTGPPEPGFAGEQGGSFSPASISLQLKAIGGGFHWSTVGAAVTWLSIVPDQGDLTANGSTQVTLTLTPAAQSLTPGRYESHILLKNYASGAIVTSNVSVLVSPKPPPPVVVAPPISGPEPLSAERERALKPKDAFRECADCPDMIVVPAGTFTMGSPASEQGRSDDEQPQRSVTIGRQLAVGQFEVTFDEWDACVAGGGCNGYKPKDEGWGRGRQPVINVSWNDANAYAAWLAKKTGKPYRLLSESEYEYAARAGTKTSYPWGDEIGKNNANCRGCGSRWDGKQTAPVGSFAANRFGLYDMNGNVWQWIEDCYHKDYQGAPQDGSAWIKGADCSIRVVRGGSWSDGPRFLRSAYRNWIATDLRYFNLGFRVGRTLSP